MRRTLLAFIVLSVCSTALGADVEEASLESWAGLIHERSVSKLPGGVETKVPLSQLEDAKEATFLVTVIKDNETLKTFTEASGGFFPKEALNVKEEVLVVVVLKRHTNAIRPDSLIVVGDGSATLKFVWAGILPEYAESFPALCRTIPKSVKVLHVETAVRKKRIATLTLR